MNYKNLVYTISLQFTFLFQSLSMILQFLKSSNSKDPVPYYLSYKCKVSFHVSFTQIFLILHLQLSCTELYFGSGSATLTRTVLYWYLDIAPPPIDHVSLQQDLRTNQFLTSCSKPIPKGSRLTKFYNDNTF